MEITGSVFLALIYPPGKIIEETSRVDAVTQNEFYFLLTLTELNGAKCVWFGRELITKQGRRGAIGF